MHGAHHTAGIGCTHEQSQCKRPHQFLGSPWARSAIGREWKHRHRNKSKTSKRRPCQNQRGVGHETRFSKDNWESTYVMIFWKSWNWPSYSRECLRYWLSWHLLAEMSSSTVKMPMSALQYFRLWMWKHVETQHWSCLSGPTDYRNSHRSGSTIQNIVVTGHFSQLKIHGPLWSMSWKYWGHFDIGPCGCWRGIQSHRISLSQCTMPCSIIWMAWGEVGLGRRHNGRKTCSSLWS